ncbi:hypothetical protein HK097_003083, partial [Rhizophlyctis rosea]
MPNSDSGASYGAPSPATQKGLSNPERDGGMENGGGTPSGEPTGRGRKRQTKACDRCRAKKRRCDGEAGNGHEPPQACTICARANLICTWEAESKKRGPKRRDNSQPPSDRPGRLSRGGSGSGGRGGSRSGDSGADSEEGERYGHNGSSSSSVRIHHKRKAGDVEPWREG